MRKMSVTQYADTVELTRQAVLAQIKENRLPEGVTAERIGHHWLILLASPL